MKKIRILAALVATVCILAGKLYAQESLGTDISKKILGCWYREYSLGQGFALKTFYPNNICKSRAVLKLFGKKYIIYIEERFELSGNKLNYVVTKSSQPGIAPVGYSTYDTIKSIAEEQTTYLDKSGKEHSRKKINPIYGWYLWLTKTVGVPEIQWSGDPLLNAK